MLWTAVPLACAWLPSRERLVRGLDTVLHEIPPRAAEGFYVVEIGFPNGMQTNYGKMLPLTQQMLGSADIITEDLRLMKRVFISYGTAVVFVLTNRRNRILFLLLLFVRECLMQTPSSVEVYFIRVMKS